MDETITVSLEHYNELKSYVQRCSFKNHPDMDDGQIIDIFYEDQEKAQSICLRNDWPIERDESYDWDEEEEAK